VRFSPDGKLIATASDDKTARIWDAETGQPITQPLGHEGFVRFAQFHPSGQILLTFGLDGIARLWDVRTGNPACESLRHDKGISSAQFSPDGRYVVTSAGNAIQTWDTRLVTSLPIKLFHEQTVQTARFTSGGSRVVTASGDGSDSSQAGLVSVWDRSTASRLPEPFRYQSVVKSFQVSPDGKRLVTIFEELNQIPRHVVAGPWQRLVGAEPTPLKPPKLWDLASGKLLTTLLGHKRQVNSAQFRPNGGCVVTTSDDGTARIWDSENGATLIPPIEHERPVCYAEFSPDGTCVAIASGESDEAHNPVGTARIWDAQTGVPVTSPLVHGTLVSSVRFSSDGRKLATISDDRTAKIWDAKTGQLLAGPLMHNGVVRSARFSPDGLQLVTASDDSTARVWDATTGEALGPPLRHDAEVNFAEFFPDGLRVMTASRDRTVRVWDTTTGQPLCDPFVHDQSIKSAAISPDGNWILTASGNYAFLWEVISAPTPVPDWLPALGEAIAGKRLSSHGAVESVGFEQILKLKQSFGKLATSDVYSRWASWFWADRYTRAVSPSSPIAFAAYLQQRLDENTLGSLTEALSIAPGNPLAIARMPAAVEKKASERTRGTNAPSLTALRKTLPVRDPHARPELIDLSQFYNASLTEPWHPAAQGSDLSELPRGIQILTGIQFDVRGLIQVGYVSQQSENYPMEVTDIPIGRTCHKLHFLHSAIRAAHFPDGVQIGTYVMHFANGGQVEFPIVIGQSVVDWVSQPNEEPKELTVAWSGFSADSRRNGRKIRLFKSTWENPTPAEVVRSIDFIATTFAPAPFLVAITME
jgi:WD40 repeat protein